MSGICKGTASFCQHFLSIELSRLQMILLKGNRSNFYIEKEQIHTGKIHRLLLEAPAYTAQKVKGDFFSLTNRIN